MNDVPVRKTGHNLHAPSLQEAEVKQSMPAKLSSSIGANKSQRTSGPVNAHLISWPSKAQNTQNLEHI